MNTKDAVFDVHCEIMNFENVKFTGSDLKDVGNAVIYAHYDKETAATGQRKAFVSLSNCMFDLSDINGSVLKGNNPETNYFNISNCTFKLKNPVSVIEQAGIYMHNSSIEATNTNSATEGSAFNNVYWDGTYDYDYDQGTQTPTQS